MTILFTEKSKKFILTTASTAYCFGIDCEANLQHLYWGKKLPWEEDYPDCREIGQAVGIGKNLENPRNLSISDFYYPYEAGKAVINEEYVGWGGLNFVEPCLKLTYPDGVRDLRLKYSTHQFIQGVQPEYSTLKEEHHQHPSAVYRQPSDTTSVPDLVVTLKDDHYPLFVHLCYRVLEDFDLILRWAEIENHCLESVWLESAQSVVWHVPDRRTYRLTYLAGRWSNEFNLKQVVMEQGKKVMESRRGIPGHHETPWFSLDPEGASTEHTGQVWFGALAWSGNWKMMVERTSNGQIPRPLGC